MGTGTASQDQLRLFPFCSPAVEEDSLGEPPMDSYDLANVYPKQQQQHYKRLKEGRSLCIVCAGGRRPGGLAYRYGLTPLSLQYTGSARDATVCVWGGGRVFRGKIPAGRVRMLPAAIEFLAPIAL